MEVLGLPIGGGGGGTAEFTVSGSLSDGQTVILKSDGNVAGITTSQIKWLGLTD